MTSRDALRDHGGDVGAANYSANDQERHAFDAACAAYAQMTGQPHTSGNDAYVTTLNQAPPSDGFRSTAPVVQERRWIDLGDRPQTASTLTQAFAAPPSQLRGATTARTTFRRWKWEAASLAPSAVVPQLARRARAPHTLPHVPNNTTPSASSTTPSTSSVFAQNFDDEAELRALLMCRPAAIPAASAAAAALRALLPYMTQDEQRAMRSRFATMTPLDALAAVLEAARRLCVRREPARVWGAPSVWTDDQLQVPGSLAAVWRRGQSDQPSAAPIPSTHEVTSPSCWSQQNLITSPSRTPTERTSSAGSGLDPSATPFSMHNLQIDDRVSPPPSSQF